jgi:hypothetical protein
VTWQVITTSPWDDDWKSTGQYWDRQSWNRTWDNWNWNNRTWNSWDSTDDNWWQAPGTDDNTQEYWAAMYGKGKGKRPQVFPMAGGAPPQYSGAPTTPQYQGPPYQGPPTQQSQGAIPGQGSPPTGNVHGSVAGALNQGTPAKQKAPAPSLNSPRTAHHQVGKQPPPQLHQELTQVPDHLQQEDNRRETARQQRLRQTAEELRREEARNAVTQDAGNQGHRQDTRNARSQPAAERRSSTGRDLPTIKIQLGRNKEFLDAALKEIDNRTGHYKIHDYIHDQVKELAQQLELHRIRYKPIREDLEYLEIEWANCRIRQMLHLYQGIFQASGNRWDLHRDGLPVSLDGRLVHPIDHYVINANPKAPNPP